MSWKVLQLATEEVQAVLAQIVLMTLPEVEDKVVDLWIVSATNFILVGYLGGVPLRL